MMYNARMQFRRAAFLLFFVTVCWCGMLAVHEFGHILAAWSSGAVVMQVVLLPVSYTVTANVQYPLFVYGAGAVVGTIVPLLLWLCVRQCCPKVAYLFRFFAGFCFVANGTYIGFDFSTAGPTDAGLLIEHGASRGILLLFGVLCLTSGLCLWNGESKHFFRYT